MLEPRPKAEGFQHTAGPRSKLSDLPVVPPSMQTDEAGQDRVLQNRQLRQEMVELKHEPDGFVAIPIALATGHAAQRVSFEKDFAEGIAAFGADGRDADRIITLRADAAPHAAMALRQRDAVF